MGVLTWLTERVWAVTADVPASFTEAPRVDFAYALEDSDPQRNNLSVNHIYDIEPSLNAYPQPPHIDIDILPRRFIDRNSNRRC